MKGFRDFLLRGNLIELAVAVIIGTAFTRVVEAFTGMVMDLIGKLGEVPDFSSRSIAGISVGAFLTALLSFLLTAAVVYFGVLVPYTRLGGQLDDEADQTAAAAATNERLLTEIRDLLRERGEPASGAAGGPRPGGVPRG